MCKCPSRLREMLAKLGYSLDSPGGTWRKGRYEVSDTEIETNHFWLAFWALEREVKDATLALHRWITR